MLSKGTQTQVNHEFEARESGFFLLIAQRHHGIHLAGPAGWDGTGEQKAWEESIAQIRQVRDLGNLPLIVVSRKQDLKGPFPEWFPAEEIKRQWQTMQSDLLHLSKQSKQIFADPSDHLVPHRQPQVVADSVLELVQAARREAK